MKTDRKRDIEAFLIECCRNSSIIFDGKYPSIKYMVGHGKIVYINRSRMLDMVEQEIPGYCAEIDEPIISELFSDSDYLKCCESHEYGKYHYVYSIMLIKEN